ncbi:superoxide dismutase family protein [Terrabacter sp. Soil810]|uniref:superoxide dismutase family protein n=1 Tax=Terrabacter sp. Soil810 TaxID=1736418 RepID=UPI0009EAE126|nr:superoxide dismutase family protein [Terrabacter sp. Soil810]
MERKGLRGGAAAVVGLSATVALAATAVAGAAVLRFADGLRDYDTAAAGPFDHATARLQLVERPDGTTAVLHVRGIDASAAGRTFGAHVHNGACGTDAPAAALGHYNADAHAGHVPVVVSAQTEVWLDFTVDATGAGDSSTAVRFPVQPGAHSVVVHAAPTDPATGLAGARLACLPVEW